MARLFLDPSEDDLDNRIDASDYFGFTSSHPKGPNVPGLVIYEPRRGTEPGRHSRFFKSFKQAQNEYLFADNDIIRAPKQRWEIY